MTGSRSLPCGATSPSVSSSASLCMEINSLDVYPPFGGGVTTYLLGFFEGFASGDNGCRFRTFVIEGNQHLCEQFRDHDKVEFVAILDRQFSGRSHFCWRASLLVRNSSGEFRRLSAEDRS